MKKLCYICSLLLLSCQANTPVFSVTDCGAVADGITDCTNAVNRCIESCSQAGGGRVEFAPGEYLCSTIHLASNVELHLQEGAVILASSDADSYDSYVPLTDMSRFDSGDGTVNQNNSRDKRWNRALILGVGVKNIAITGEGIIDGAHVFDPLGEESMRGPHTILLAESSGIRLDGITIRRASNYAFMAYDIHDASFSNMHIMEGWDGIHIRGGENVEIADCLLETGDDCIAGGFWKNFEVYGCTVNSSCNGVRMIMPCDGLDIHDCTFRGPGVYPHRTSGEQKRCNMLFAISLEPGGWGPAPGDVKNIHLHDLRITRVQSPLSISISALNHASGLIIEDIDASGIYGTMSPTVCWNDTGFDDITIKNFKITK